MRKQKLQRLCAYDLARAAVVLGDGFAQLQFAGFSLLLAGIYLSEKGEKG